MIIIGTAGHIDHGKTTLIRTLTGIETDRLKEEQQRGISIELGFAYLDLPSGQRVGLIDVPGHERFVRHMIAGATGVDVVILVVAADEGVMPQTREHIAICELLGMKKGIVVLTKTDLVDEEWLELVRDDIQDYLSKTFLSNARILDFAAIWEGERLESFRGLLYSTILEETQALEKGNLGRPAMMPVDRIFTIHGFGTIVTGTVQSGTLRVGDAVRILPGEIRSKVRRLENHGQLASESSSGTRTAVNVPDAQLDSVHRGDVLVVGDKLSALSRLTGKLSVVPNLTTEMKIQFKALFHAGSAMAEAAVRVLDSHPPGPGDEVYVGIRLSRPLAFLPGDRFVLRGFSALADYGKTLGGGAILWPDSVKARPENMQALENLTSEEPALIQNGLARLAGLKGLRKSDLTYYSTLPPEQLSSPGHDVLELSVAGQPTLVHEAHFASYREHLLAVVDLHHELYPRQPGVLREELKTRVPAYLDRDVVQAAISHLLKTCELKGIGLKIARAGFEPRLDEAFKALATAVEKRLAGSGLTPPGRAELVAETGSDDKIFGEVLGHLVGEGAIVRVASDLYLHATPEARARRQLIDFLGNQPTVTTQELKDLWGLTRKYLIPLAEYYDQSKLTVRVDSSTRRLRK
jgi:selenocysteine-specific elongation factor